MPNERVPPEGNVDFTQDPTTRCKALSLGDLDRSLEHVYVWKAKVFTLFAAASNLSSKNSTCGQVIDLLISICFAKPEFIADGDTSRYASFLHDFKHFKIRLWGMTESTEVSELPFRDLGTALESWIFSFFNDQDSGLFPHYALDTARFIEAMVCGFDSHEPEPWKIEPVLKLSEDDHHVFNYLDRRFKKEFTESINLVVAGRIPEGWTVNRFGEPFLQAGDEFRFGVRRCHLSSSYRDFTYLQFIGSSQRPYFDIASNFKLQGGFLDQRNGYRADELVDIPDAASLPPEWVTHEMRYRPNDGSYLPIPAPTWRA